MNVGISGCGYSAELDSSIYTYNSINYTYEVCDRIIGEPWVLVAVLLCSRGRHTG